jgi:hypothetical protein
MRKVAAMLLLCIGSSIGCYHGTIITGATPSTETIEKSFASSWIYGLVPPSTVETAAKCPNGVAKVETQLSFVNELVYVLTLGIYTPMSIKVTCAAKNTAAITANHPDLAVGTESGSDAIQAAFAQAADQAVRDHKVVLVQVTP